MKSVELLLLYLIWLCPCITESCVLQEKDILLQFKHHIISTNQYDKLFGEFLSSWNNATHCCHDWQGLKCDENSYHVRGLHLDGIGLKTSTGEFLSPLSNLHSLTDLSLGGNFLNISAVIVVLANFSKLSYLDLGYMMYNVEPRVTRDLQFQGWSDNSLAKLEHLDLSGNSLHGKVPPQLSKMSSLMGLDLRGSIPMIMSQLSGFGESRENGNDTSVPFFDGLDFNSKGIYLHYSILPTGLEVIDLSGNFLTSNIPKDMGNLTSLKQLNLSRNHLQGHIFPSITRMQALESLDLSFNQLTGRIPAGMERMSSLEVLNLSYNNFSGWIPRGGQMLTFAESSFYGNPNLRDTLPHIITLPSRLKCFIQQKRKRIHNYGGKWWVCVMALGLEASI